MLTLKAFVAGVVLAGTALLSGGVGYAISRATLTSQITVPCPGASSAAAPPARLHALPNGPTPALNAGRRW